MNRIDFSERTAVVTGGAQGIGRAVAERLRIGGARVAIWDMDAALAETTAHALGRVLLPSVVMFPTGPAFKPRFAGQRKYWNALISS